MVSFCVLCVYCLVYSTSAIDCLERIISEITYVSSETLKGHSGAELHIYFLVHLESIYYQIFFYSKIVPNCAVAK